MTARAAIPHPLHRFASLSLAELEALPCLLLAVLLPLDHSRITCDMPIAAKRGLERLVDLDKRTGDTMTYCSGLTGAATAMNIRVDIEPVEHFDRGKRGENCLAIETIGEILLECPTIDSHLTAPWRQVDTRYRALAPTYIDGMWH